MNRGDWVATLSETMHDDVEIDWSRSPAPYAGVYRGREEAMRFADALDVWEDARLDAAEFIDAGDDVLVPHVSFLRGRDGIEVSVRATYVFTIRDGLCARWCIYQDHAEALEAVGVSA